jgi:hypothetical protein
MNKKEIIIINYPNLNIFSKNQLGGVHHLKANIEGLKLYFSKVIVLCSISRHLIIREQNVIYLNIIPFLDKKRDLEKELSVFNSSKSIVYGLKIFLKGFLNLSVNLNINLFCVLFNISLYERANKILNLRSKLFKIKIIEINDEYFPKDINFFEIALCVKSNHFKKKFSGKIIEQPWPTNIKNNHLKFKQSIKVAKLLVINTSPFGFDYDYLSAQLKMNPNIRDIVYIGYDNLVINSYNIINYSIVNQELYFELIDSVDAVYISYSKSMTIARSEMGFPMKFIDVLSRGRIVFTNIPFDFIKNYGLENWILLNFHDVKYLEKNDILGLNTFFEKYLSPTNYFKNILE